MILPIYLNFKFMIRRIKPINLDKKFYSTKNEEFSNLINYLIFDLNKRTIIIIISSILALIVLIIIIVELIINNKSKNKNVSKG